MVIGKCFVATFEEVFPHVAPGGAVAPFGFRRPEAARGLNDGRGKCWPGLTGGMPPDPIIADVTND